MQRSGLGEALVIFWGTCIYVIKGAWVEPNCDLPECDKIGSDKVPRFPVSTCKPKLFSITAS